MSFLSDVHVVETDQHDIDRDFVPVGDEFAGLETAKVVPGPPARFTPLVLGRNVGGVADDEQ